MDQIKTLLRNYLASGSIKATARQLKVSKNTVRDYLRRAEACSADLSALLELDDESLSRILYSPGSLGTDSRLAVFEQKVEGWIKELRRVGVTRELLWQEYRAEHSDGYGYSQFCEHLSRHVAQRDLTLALDHTPGEVLMVVLPVKKWSGSIAIAAKYILAKCWWRCCLFPIIVFASRCRRKVLRTLSRV